MPSSDKSSKKKPPTTSSVVYNERGERNGFVVNGCTFNVHGKYELIDAIGQGSYGVVCSCLDTQTNEKVAIKKIKPMAGDDWDASK